MRCRGCSRPAEGDDKDLTATVMRADATGPAELSVRALGDDGRLLGAQGDALRPARRKAVAHLPNCRASCAIAPARDRDRGRSLGRRRAAARWSRRRRPVGVVTARGLALQPAAPQRRVLSRESAELRSARCAKAAVDNLLKGDIAVLTLPDISPAGPAEKDQIVSNGWKTAARCCALPGRISPMRPHDDLLPVTLLRRGGRTLAARSPGRLRLRSRRLLRRALLCRGWRFRKTSPSRAKCSPKPTADLGAKTWASDRRHAAGHCRETRQRLAHPGSHDRRARNGRRSASPASSSTSALRRTVVAERRRFRQ